MTPEPNQITPAPDKPTELQEPAHAVTKESYQELLAESIERFVVCRLLIGASHIETVAGFLMNVGNNFFTLFDPCARVHTTYDLYSLKFFSVYDQGTPDINQYCQYRLYTAPLS